MIGTLEMNRIYDGNVNVDKMLYAQSFWNPSFKLGDRVYFKNKCDTHEIQGNSRELLCLVI